jgi:hypothetical protein
MNRITFEFWCIDDCKLEFGEFSLQTVREWIVWNTKGRAL